MPGGKLAGAATAEGFLALVRPELEQVDSALREGSRPGHAVLDPALSLLLAGSGKRLRPVLALLSGRTGEADTSALVRMAAGVELLHVASLVHDDVVDGAAVRRGVPTLNAVLGSQSAVLVGDYLFGQAAAFSVSTGNLLVVELFAQTVEDMSRGQLEEASRREDSHFCLTREEYYQTICSKTASLFVLACQGGAILGGLAEHQVQALRDFGEKTGLAFQIVDDILDFTGDDQALGKPVGTDLRHGVVTLPVLHLREVLSEEQFRLAFRWDGHPEEAVQRVIGLVQDSPAVERSYREAVQLAENALASLRAVPRGEARDALESVVDYIVHREA